MRENIPYVEKRFTNTPVLRDLNFERELIPQSDASNSGMGIVLSQENERTSSPVSEYGILRCREAV